MYQQILVPLDGSDTAQRGLREAIGLARLLKARLRLLHIVSDYGPVLEVGYGVDYDQVRSGLHQHGRDLIEKASAEARAAGLEAAGELREARGARVCDMIVEDARESRCDLIVIGTHGRRGVRRALIGSDAEGVVRQSPVPVLLVRAAGAES